MTMLVALAAILALFAAVHIFFSAAVIFHLRRYTLPGWSAPRIIIPLYCILSLLLFGFALYSLYTIAQFR